MRMIYHTPSYHGPRSGPLQTRTPKTQLAQVERTWEEQTKIIVLTLRGGRERLQHYHLQTKRCRENFMDITLGTKRDFPKSDPPYGSSASIPLTWVSVSTRSPPLGSGPPGTWTALRDKFFSCAQRKSWHACLFRVRDLEPPWRLMWDRNGRKWVKARWTTLNSRPFMCQARYLPDQTP